MIVYLTIMSPTTCKRLRLALFVQLVFVVAEKPVTYISRLNHITNICVRIWKRTSFSSPCFLKLGQTPPHPRYCHLSFIFIWCGCAVHENTLLYSQTMQLCNNVSFVLQCKIIFFCHACLRTHNTETYENSDSFLKFHSSICTKQNLQRKRH